jgi:hypothetical protein
MSLKCPYCEYEMREPDDCHDQDETYDHECPKCHHNFVFTVAYTRHYSESKAPCLNGAPHDWQPIKGIPAEYFEGKQRCTHCDYRRTIQPKETPC